MLKRKIFDRVVAILPTVLFSLTNHLHWLYWFQKYLKKWTRIILRVYALFIPWKVATFNGINGMRTVFFFFCLFFTVWLWNIGIYIYVPGVEVWRIAVIIILLIIIITHNDSTARLRIYLWFVRGKAHACACRTLWSYKHFSSFGVIRHRYTEQNKWTLRACIWTVWTGNVRFERFYDRRR